MQFFEAFLTIVSIFIFYYLYFNSLFYFNVYYLFFLVIEFYAITDNVVNASNFEQFSRKKKKTIRRYKE